MFEFSKEKIKFPVNFDLKVIMEARAENEENEKLILNILFKLQISTGRKSYKFSSKGKYVSFTFNITLETQEIMNALYYELSQEPGVRFAV